ncbi:MAG TPA: hypothetical protein VGX23_30225 [Actinocrinis sp.]|nr:hypothetical protein [Actinocrinis sp.]
MTDPDDAVRLLAALAAAHFADDRACGADPARYRRIACIAVQRWATFARRHPGFGADTLSCRTEDLARGLLARCRPPAAPGAAPGIADYRALAARLAPVLAARDPLARAASRAQAG